MDAIFITTTAIKEEASSMKIDQAVLGILYVVPYALTIIIIFYLTKIFTKIPQLIISFSDPKFKEIVL